MKIGNKIIGRDSMEYYVIAEAGVNHEGSLETAKKQVELAKLGGADAIKFQAYKADKLASVHSPAYWDLTKEPTKNQFELFKKHDQFGEVEYKALSKHCAEVGIDFLCTAFDDDSFRYIDPLVHSHKIASADLTNIPMLRMVAKTKKPIILSTGAAEFREVYIALDEIRRLGGGPVALLHCVLNYPNLDHNAFISRISFLRNEFSDCVVGYSDHTLPFDGCFPNILAYALGARVIEKHFTHDKTLVGNDHYHAMDYIDLQEMVHLLDRSKLLLKPVSEEVFLDSQKQAIMNARRSIVLRQDLPAGTVLLEKHLIPKRPGTGVSPIEWDNVVGRKLIKDLRADAVLQWDDLADK